ncbi:MULTISPECIES: methionine ABC transporter permease [unclassified Streptomyces]|uniref:methionine ABC transporter permease n=1 Tax=unclassified Streptomyces TaxID=2593676 RepID=UPI00088B0754|nr:MULTISPECIES: methionine ABC transporter permease [unclassified Streptomyces]PBC81358.1 D-methionine transport system permease protein [Streptomyces sp. 2321.6]SDR55420.1 D-methionine transport system permease protein [Streptomyces sp. KS_16]SEC11789.1 D-methionine transport system permease protein [Streptomyces sp. 2133.1]SNC65010.1 D-methionine transport system permease protein [Streptomyces sp. 2114.4]
MTWSEMQPLLYDNTLDTLFMVWWSTFYAVLFGIPVGVLLHLTDRGAVLRNLTVNKVLGAIVNIGRSFPFLILIVWLIPFTRFLVGVSIGPTGAVVPLTIAAIPFFARLVESALREVDSGLVEAAHAMGGGTWTVIFKVLLPQALPALIAGVTTLVIQLIGYSAIAGTVGGGGLGNLAYTYGYQQYESRLMVVTVIELVIIVTVVQYLGDYVVRRLAERGTRTSSLRVGLRRARAEEPAAVTEAA